MRIVGVSFDAPAKNAEWAARQGYRFELWTDAGRELAMHYGAADSADQGTAARLTVLLDADGRAIARWSPGLRMGVHPSEVLDDLKVLLGHP